MQNQLHWFILFLSTFVFFLLQAATILPVFDRKLQWRKLVLFAIINSLAREFPMLLIPQYLSMVLYLGIYIVVMIITLRFIFRLKYLHSLLSTCILVLGSTVVEYIGLAILKVSYPGGLNLETFSLSFINIVIGRNLANFLWLVLAVTTYYLKMKINIPEDINRKRMMGIIVNGLITMVLVIPNILFFSDRIVGIPVEMIVFNGASVLVLLLVSLYNSVHIGELEIKRQEVETQKLYINTLNDLIDGLRGFKHDFNNIVQAIGGYLALNDIEGLKKYHLQMQSESRKINNIIPLNSYVKENPAVYGLLLSKISYSEMKDIMFTINILCPINNINMKIYELCKVLGILLDNAIEAAFDSEKQYVELNIKNNGQGSNMIIEVINTFGGEIDVDRIYSNGYTTKQDHSGFGLWEVKKIIARNKNCSLKTFVDNSFFTQRIEIL